MAAIQNNNSAPGNNMIQSNVLERPNSTLKSRNNEGRKTQKEQGNKDNENNTKKRRQLVGTAGANGGSSSNNSQMSLQMTPKNNGQQSQTSLVKPPSTSQHFSRKTLETGGGTFSSTDLVDQKQLQQHQLSLSSVHGLKFDCNFECGNLELVREKEANVYDIIIRNDSNSAGHIQWFYFRVRTPNCSKSQLPNVKFNIMNLTKKDSLFEQGMKVTIFSKKSGIGWTQGGQNYSYSRSNIHGEINYLNSKQQTYNCLSFEYKFEYSDDEVFFAYTLPYTYTMMQRHLLALNQLKDLKEHKMLEVCSLGRSNGHLDMPLIKIKSGRPPNHGGIGQKHEREEKPVIFIIGRQHPGETFSSFIIHGLINFLLTSHPAVLQLREIFDFWIMPIANPDGVVLGNYRCNIQGKDINRCFQFSNDEEYGGTYSSVKECECIQTFMNENIFINQKNSKNPKVTQSLNQPFGLNQGESRIKLFLDIHTHSSQRGIFTYAPCAQIQESIKIRSFPQILDEVSQYFRLASCKYQSEKTKRNCARLAFVRDYKAEYSYTIEASSYAYVEKKTNQTYQLKEQDLLMFGKQIVMAIAKLFMIDPINGTIIPSQNGAISEIKPTPIDQQVYYSVPRLIGYNLQLDFGLRRQWRPPLDLMKLVKSVQAKFMQPKIFNPPPIIETKPTVAQILKGKYQGNDSSSNKTAQEKRQQYGLQSGTGNRSNNPNDSAKRLEKRLSDASQPQGAKQQSKTENILDSEAKQSAFSMPTGQNSPLKQTINPYPLTRQHKEPMKIKSSVYQMAYNGELLVAAAGQNEEISLGQQTPQNVTNEIINKILNKKAQDNGGKSGTSGQNGDGVIIKHQMRNHNNLIAYSQKLKNLNDHNHIDTDKFVIQITGYLDEPESPFSQSLKTKDFLNHQIKKVQNQKLTQNGNRTRFLNYGGGSPLFNPMLATPMTVLNQHYNTAGGGGGSATNSNQTFRSDSLTMNLNNAFPELTQFSQTQQMIVPAKMYQKSSPGGVTLAAAGKLQKTGQQATLKPRDLSSLLKVPSSHVYAQPTLPIQSQQQQQQQVIGGLYSRSERPILPANHPIGEKSMEEDEISMTHEAIPVRDFEAPDLSGQGSLSRLRQLQQSAGDSPSKLSSKLTKRKFNATVGIRNQFNSLETANGQGSSSTILESKVPQTTIKNYSTINGLNGVGGILPQFVKKPSDAASVMQPPLGNNTLDPSLQGGSKTKVDGPSTGQLQSKLEMIEQKSRDFKEYLKIQLQEVHENHMKDKFPYNRIGLEQKGLENSQNQGISGDRSMVGSKANGRSSPQSLPPPRYRLEEVKSPVQPSLNHKLLHQGSSSPQKELSDAFKHYNQQINENSGKNGGIMSVRGAPNNPLQNAYINGGISRVTSANITQNAVTVPSTANITSNLRNHNHRQLPPPSLPWGEQTQTAVPMAIQQMKPYYSTGEQALGTSMQDQTFRAGGVSLVAGLGGGGRIGGGSHFKSRQTNNNSSQLQNNSLNTLSLNNPNILIKGVNDSSQDQLLTSIMMTDSHRNKSGYVNEEDHAQQLLNEPQDKSLKEKKPQYRAQQQQPSGNPRPAIVTLQGSSSTTDIERSSLGKRPSVAPYQPQYLHIQPLSNAQQTTSSTPARTNEFYTSTKVKVASPFTKKGAKSFESAAGASTTSTS